MSRYLDILRKISTSQQLQACLMMTIGLCFHFLGYECSRAASITLLAANDVGGEAIPLTIALGSPASGFVLYLYTKSIKSYGSTLTLRISFIFCLMFMSYIALFCSELKGFYGKVAIISFYAFREIYVSLLSSQQWAFIASTLDKSTSSYIVCFSGIVSVASAIGGCSIEQLVNIGGVTCLLYSALIATFGSFLCAEVSYLLLSNQNNDIQKLTANIQNDKNNENHHNHHEKENNNDHIISDNNKSSASNQTNIITTSVIDSKEEEKSRINLNKKSGFLIDSWNMVMKHKLLQVLFIEALTHQLCCNMLNLMFHNGLRSEVDTDAIRAMLVGRFFASVNICACTLQLVVLPHVLSHNTLPTVLLTIPFIVFIAVLLGVIRPGLISVMLGFGTIKVLEYSIMHSASEMIYMPMGHEVRYLGKELIRYFGHKLGKSGASLLLSAAVAHFNPSLSTQSIWGAVLSLLWGGMMFVLSILLIERDRLDEVPSNMIRNSDKQLHTTVPISSNLTVSAKKKRKSETKQTDLTILNNTTITTVQSENTPLTNVSTLRHRRNRNYHNSTIEVVARGDSSPEVKEIRKSFKSNIHQDNEQNVIMQSSINKDVIVDENLDDEIISISPQTTIHSYSIFSSASSDDNSDNNEGNNLLPSEDIFEGNFYYGDTEHQEGVDINKIKLEQQQNRDYSKSQHDYTIESMKMKAQPIMLRSARSSALLLEYNTAK